MQGAVQITRLVDGIGVGEEQPAASRPSDRRPDGIVLARPYWFLAGLQLPCPDHHDPGKAAGNLIRNLGRPVGRVVVHYDQLPVAAQLKDFL